MNNKNSFISKLSNAVKEGRLIKTLDTKYGPDIKGLRYIFHNPAKGSIRLHNPDKMEINKNDSELVSRIFDAYRLMKKDQQNISDPRLLPARIWQDHIDEDYRYLVQGLAENNIEKFHYFLENFGIWDSYTGIENAPLAIKNASKTRELYLINHLFANNLKYWKYITEQSINNKIEDLSYPTHGNQCGAYVDEQFISIGSFTNNIYGTMLQSLLSDIDHPVMADIGGGYGKLGYFTLRNFPKSTFIDFDLPEILCVAAYYLMKTWPEKKALLYGEGDYNSERHKEYDLIFMPNFEITKVGSNTVDLFTNKNSLGEMSKDCVLNYLDYIYQATEYFFHLNHESVRRMGDDSLLAGEYPVPSNFKKMIRYPAIDSLLFSGKLDFSDDIFFYLMQRK